MGALLAVMILFNLFPSVMNFDSGQVSERHSKQLWIAMLVMEILAVFASFAAPSIEKYDLASPKVKFYSLAKSLVLCLMLVVLWELISGELINTQAIFCDDSKSGRFARIRRSRQVFYTAALFCALVMSRTAWFDVQFKLDSKWSTGIVAALALLAANGIWFVYGAYRLKRRVPLVVRIALYSTCCVVAFHVVCILLPSTSYLDATMDGLLVTLLYDAPFILFLTVINTTTITKYKTYKRRASTFYINPHHRRGSKQV